MKLFLLFLVSATSAGCSLAAAQDLEFKMDTQKFEKLAAELHINGSNSHDTNELIDRAAAAVETFCPDCNTGEIPIGHPPVLGPMGGLTSLPSIKCPPDSDVGDAGLDDEKCKISFFQMQRAKQVEQFASKLIVTHSDLVKTAEFIDLKDVLVNWQTGGVPDGHPESLGKGKK